MFKDEPKKDPTIKQMAREVTQEQTMPVMLGNYFNDLADNLKQALHDVAMASGKVANSLGADIDSDRMDQRLHQLFDWQYGTKLSSSEVRKLEAKYNDVIDEVSVDNQLDLEDEEQLQQANNLASYKIFISKLKQEQVKARDEGIANLL